MRSTLTFDERRAVNASLRKYGVKLGVDGEAEALSNENGERIADSAKAHRIMQACAGNLSYEDMTLVVDLLKNAELLDDSEARALLDALDPKANDPDEVAMDAAFPHRHRLGTVPALYVDPGATMHRREKYVVPSAGQIAAMDARFPDAKRLQVNGGRGSFDERSFDERFGTARIK